MGVIEELNNRIDNKIPAVVPKAIQPTFLWETVVGYLAHCADTQVGGPIGVMYYKLPKADQIESIAPVKEFLSENLKREILGVDMYITLTTKGDYKYSSDNDVLVWNAIGRSELNINEEEKHLEPGDLIYIPAGIEYTYKPQTARTYLVFALQGEV
jgi:quercetin dioxygenase-like cupin family protein